MSTQKLDLENIFIEANVKPGETFYSMLFDEVTYDNIINYLGTTLIVFRLKNGSEVSYTCDGHIYGFHHDDNSLDIFPNMYECDWMKWLEERTKENKPKTNLFQVENRIIYLVLKPENFTKELTMREWNDFIDRYTNDKNSVVEPYDETMDGYVFITTSLENILNNHSHNDLRFLVPEKTEYHKTNYKL